MAYEVTIGIPVYNVSKYIRLAMESALAQTFDSIEFLICDDCGIDDSIDIICEYQQQHPRGKDIRIVRQPKNMGIGAGRNRIVDEAQGKFLYFMDADDTIAPNTIQLLYDNAQKYHAELVYGSHERIEEYAEEVKRVKKQYPNIQFTHEDTYANYAFEQYNRIEAMVWNILIDMEVFRKNGLYFNLINYWEDLTFTMDLPTYVTRVVLLSDITYHYYCRIGSLSQFGARDHIDKSEIMQTMRAVNKLKENSECMIHKPYFPNRMLKVMKTCFYICCSILRNREKINPSFEKRELRDLMRFPVPWSAVCSFHHLPLFMMGKLPPSLSVRLIILLGKVMHLV
jgi:glycosyltransferase involved in cell wall biosynthesis